MFWKTPLFRHLRLPFSWFLLPAFLMGLWEVDVKAPEHLWLLFGLLHLLIYPSSNAFNSLQDQDEGPIGGMERPPQAPPALGPLSLGMDVVALALAAWVHPGLSLGLLVYILASRAYSYRPIRLKKYPWLGFFTVVFFQGPWVILLTALFVPPVFAWENALAPGWLYLASALVLGGSYPLTQIYQHAADLRDGVRSLSAHLGVQGTFRWSALAFTAAGPVLLLPLFFSDRLPALFLLALALVPVLTYFFSWWRRCTKDPAAANFRNTMRMNVLAASALNLALAALIFFAL